MKTQTLGTSDLQVSQIRYGAMSIGRSYDNTPLTDSVRQSALQILHTALDAGINFFDHADIYCNGKSEKAFADLWKGAQHLRQQIYLQTKCGILFGPPHRFDFSYEHIIASVKGSLKRLQTDYIDVLLLHRPDPLVEPEEVAQAFDELKHSGKVRWFGVSNHTAAQLDFLRKYLNQPIVTNQVEFNLVHTQMLDEGILFNQNNSRITRNEGVIEYCRLHNITLQAWAPLANGWITGNPRQNAPEHFSATAELVAHMAKEKDVPPEAIIIAWILRHPAHIQPLPGTINSKRLLAAFEAEHVNLTREEWFSLFTAGRGETMP